MMDDVGNVVAAGVTAAGDDTSDDGSTSDNDASTATATDWSIAYAFSRYA